MKSKNKKMEQIIKLYVDLRDTRYVTGELHILNESEAIELIRHEYEGIKKFNVDIQSSNSGLIKRVIALEKIIKENNIVL